MCGSGLAREEAIGFNINVDCHAAFASKPAPTKAGVLPQVLIAWSIQGMSLFAVTDINRCQCFDLCAIDPYGLGVMHEY
ncbi:hypothetical protein BK665_17305 [Pseudomonas frederiksbergensis]|uniref:Uncharacterized protein n=1 Tax=Pseudomonas frederiksbergensis TaxID=104087 RepID=A0A423KFT2_9PSED|nr:hypothetical protein BK665_17305 [Pseudomonas frederiksbergensis]